MPETTAEHASQIAREKLASPDLIQAVLKPNLSEKITFRPVEIKGRRMVQVSNFDGRKTNVQNYAGDELSTFLDELLSIPFRSLHVSAAAEETQIQFSKKGKPLVTVKRRVAPATPDLRHDRTIQRPLPEGQPNPFLQTIGMMTADGRIKADRQRKFQQINEFIRLVSETADLQRLSEGPLLIVDFGCGNAYLTFALHHYLNAKLGVKCELIGVDRNSELIARNEAKASELGSDTIRFVTSGIDEFVPPRPPDIVVALHACDTATDAALAQAIKAEAKLIFTAPCCHHHLQVQLSASEPADGHSAIMRDGILRERLGDIITDTLRAMLLRIAGYKVDVIEFTSPEHTAKNLLIRAKMVSRTASPDLIGEYKALKKSFGVTPYLEQLLPNWECGLQSNAIQLLVSPPTL